MLFFCHLQLPTVLGICKGKRLRSERERLKNEQEHREIRLSSERGADLSGMVRGRSDARDSEHRRRTVGQVRACTRAQREQEQHFNLRLCVEKHHLSL